MDFAIICNSDSDELYRHSLSFYEHLPYDKLKVSGENGFYNFKFINDLILNGEKYPYDWVALIDEDCFITDTHEMMNLVKYQIENNIHMSGMPDGGVLPLREFNPVSINTYFTILNLKEIREVYNEVEVLKTIYDKSLDVNIREDLMKGRYFSNKITYLNRKCNPYNFEPYYRIFFWLLKKGLKIEYLDAELLDSKNDNIANILKNHNNIPFACHSWRARQFKTNSDNKKRILNIIKHCKEISINANK